MALEANTKVLVENISTATVGIDCINYPAHYSIPRERSLGIKWEHLLDASYLSGFKKLFEEGFLRIAENDSNYTEVMEELGFGEIKEEIVSNVSLREAKELLSKRMVHFTIEKVKREIENGSPETRRNFAQAVIELKIRNYAINECIKKYTGIDTIKIQEDAEKE